MVFCKLKRRKKAEKKLYFICNILFKTKQKKFKSNTLLKQIKKVLEVVVYFLASAGKSWTSTTLAGRLCGNKCWIKICWRQNTILKTKNEKQIKKKNKNNAQKVDKTKQKYWKYYCIWVNNNWQCKRSTFSL